MLKCLHILLSLIVLPIVLQAQPHWSVHMDDLGTFSSPRVADLNQDGIGDIIMGAGRQEFISCDTAIFALDGKDGHLLWKVGARDQIFGSAALMDISGDRVPDVFIGGRSAELRAINGHTGSVIWEFFPEGDSILARQQALYNFYNPQFIPDQNQDGYPDILISNGGDVTVPAYDPNRAPGHLMVIDSRTGQQLAKAVMPDGKEIYMSVVISDLEKDGVLDIIYGTGGETIGGNLYRTSLQSVLKEDLSNSTLLATGKDKGFIAPPVVVDITGDGIEDIVVNAVDGRMLAFNGKDNQPIWAGQIPGTEVYSSLAVGDLTGDEVPDFFGVFAIGVWPDLKSTRPLLVDGKKGELVFMDSIGFYQTSSPLIADLNADGGNDALVSVNFFLPDSLGNKTVHHTLLAYDFYKKSKYALLPPQVGSNVASTPWMGDLDGDGFLDVIYCHMTTPDRTYTYDGFRVSRLKTQVPVGKGVVWGAYMGNRYDGIFRLERE